MPKEVFDQTGGRLSPVVRSLLRVGSEPGNAEFAETASPIPTGFGIVDVDAVD
jgi:hypothetical protein